MVALVVRLVWMPSWERLRFDGHERLYVAAMNGVPPDASTQALPALLGLAQLLGRVTQDPRVLVGLSVASGAVAVLATALWTRRRFGGRAGLWAGLSVALLAEHAAWSTSAYPVMLPHALLVCAFACEGRGWKTELGAAALIAAACSFRLELCLLAPLRGWPALAGLVGVAWWWVLPSATPSDPLVALQLNLPLLMMLGPPALGLALLGLPRAWPLILAAAWVHLVGSAFDDYGHRHALLGGVALCVAGGVAAARPRWGWLVGLGLLAGLAWDTQELSERWHARPVPEQADALPRLSGTEAPALPEGCVEVTEEPPIEGQPLPSHVAWFAGELEAPCVLWGEEDQHGGWSSRGLRDRALRMRATYALTPVGVWWRGRHANPRVYHRLERR